MDTDRELSHAHPARAIKAMLIRWCDRHDTCLRADRGALAQMDWPSFKPAQQ
jgi:hypothetical protein